MHSNVTSKNVSWPHFSWTTLYAAKRTIHHLEYPDVESDLAECTVQ